MADVAEPGLTSFYLLPFAFYLLPLREYTPARVRWSYRDPPLIWLFVAAYALHIVEEYLGGFPEWFGFIAGGPLGRDAFVIINMFGLAAMSAAARAAARRESLGWIAIAIATVVFVNGIAHLLGSLVSASYSPGLITGVVLYLPLGQLALIRAWRQVTPSFFWRGVATGLAAHAVVVFIAVGTVRAP